MPRGSHFQAHDPTGGPPSRDPRRPMFAAGYPVPIASGFLAGESLMGVLIVVPEVSNVLPM